MTISDPQPTHPLITDPFLLSILQTSTSTRQAVLTLLDLTHKDPTTSPQPPTAHALAVVRAQKPLFAHLSHLRGLNRRLAHAVRQTKSHTSASRLEVDTLHLSLQNLYYESRHLVGEIAACENFPHSFAELPLEGEEEFLERFPDWEEKRGLEGEGEGEEGLMKARIEAEAQERMRLEEQRKGLVARKMELVRENAKRKEELGKLDRDLEAFIDAAKPIQKTFEKEW